MFQEAMKTHEASKHVPGCGLAIALVCLAPATLCGQSSGRDTALNSLSTNSYQAFVNTLEGFGTRYYSTPQNGQARDYIYSTFQEYGLAVEKHSFQYGGGTYQNVVGTLAGSDPDAPILLLGAHFDSVSNDRLNHAPGADDNASGTAAVLEIARVLSAFQPTNTIKFVAFNAEEVGLVGSNAYAADLEASGRMMRAMINFDMIGYADAGPIEDFELMGTPWVVDFMAVRFNEIGRAVEPHYDLYAYSDYVPFSPLNYPGSSSLMIIEDTANEVWGGSNPYYHTTGDVSSRLDYEFAFDAVRAATLATYDLAEMNVVPEPGFGALLAIAMATLAIRRERRSS
jgi:Zn-dependent M28 family amino/carboxypeptidase